MMTNITYRSNAGSMARRLLETSALTLVFSAGLLAAGMGAARAGAIDNEAIKIIGSTDQSSSAGISGDGKVVVGTLTGMSQTYGFRWDVDGGWNALDALATTPVVPNTTARAVNDDGSVIAGSSTDSAGYMRAVRWTNGVIEQLYTPVSPEAAATGVSGNGSIVVGYFNNGGSGFGVRWEEGGTLFLLGQDPIETTRANGISRDGTVIVGEAGDGFSYRYAVRWTDGGRVANDLGDFPGLGLWSTASAASNDGSVIVGSFQPLQDTTHAFRWTEAQGVVDIDGFDSHYSVANAVSGDGSVIVGQVDLGQDDYHAFRWADGTSKTVVQWLRDNGVSIGNDPTRTATGVSEDGKIIVGDTQNGGTYIARVVTPDTGDGDTPNTGDGDTPGPTSGIIDVQQYSTTLVAKPSAQVGLGYANTVLQGAHGEPMRDLLGLGQRSVAFTSDIGYDDSRVSNGGVGIGDVTFGYGLAEGVTARFAGGGLYTKQDIETGGDFHQAAFYMSPEATIALGSSNVYATIGGYYSTGRMNIHRGYMNGAAMDFSHGETDVDTYGAKIRFDWLNAATIAGTKLTPYASLTYAHSHMDGYTEEGGSFPSAFDSVNDHSTVARIGVDFIHDVTDTVRLTARAEADYRFEKTTAGTSGQIVGLSAFEFDGEDVKQLWLRGAIGTEFDVAGGTASLGINVTTEGDDPNVWLRSGWNVKF